jgi:nicotinate-nucleotide--dimethylbenzimidazole phosphoribosyltransferase
MQGPDALAVGEIGVGGGVAASALVACLYGGDPEFWSRVGAWTPPEMGQRRTEAVNRALYANRGQLEDPLQALTRLGGRELAATAGAIAAARVQGIPVVLDGFVTCAAAAVLKQINDCALDHCVAAHVSAEPAHQALLDRIDKVPLLDLGIRFGEGVGSTLAFALLRGACAVLEGEGANAGT